MPNAKPMCILKNCASVASTTVTLHEFPKSELLRDKWLEFARKYGNCNPNDLTRPRLCSKHFEKECFSNYQQVVDFHLSSRLLLLPQAIPTIPPTEELRKDMMVLPTVKVGTKRQINEYSPRTNELPVRLHMVDQKTSPFKATMIGRTYQTQTDKQDFKKAKLLQKGKVFQTPQPSTSTTTIDEPNQEEHVPAVLQEHDSDYSESSHDESSSDEDEDNSLAFHDNIMQSLNGSPSYDSEPKVIVFISALLPLLQHCIKDSCSAKGDSIGVQLKRNGACLIAERTCSRCHHSSTWRSSPVYKKQAVINVIISASIIMAGLISRKVLRMMQFFNLLTVSSTTYYRHQRLRLFQSIRTVYKRKQSDLVDQLSNEENIKISGDARCDSMGHSAKYGTYELYCDNIKKILGFKTIIKIEVTSSNAMELEGCKRMFAWMKEVGIYSRVRSFITDRHLGIAKWMREINPSIVHLFDAWHVVKGLCKKLEKIAKLSGCGIIADWLPSIRNHVYWCLSSTEQDNADEKEAKYTSLVNHIINKHTHDNINFPMCHHDELDEAEVREKLWFEEDSYPYEKLCEAYLSTRCKNEIRKTSGADQTSHLESFHSLVNRFCPKMIHFGYYGMKARVSLAILHFNENCDREQAVKDDKLKYKVVFPKYRNGEYVVKKVKDEPTYEYVKEIFIDIWANLTKKQICLPPKDDNITATFPKEENFKEVAIERHKSRFRTNDC